MRSLVIISIVFLALASCSLASERRDWAVLVAGSNTYMNYRHQADVCHAYQILHKHGIPDERIIVFMYDDIAHNKANPMPGVIINKPNGTNVYPGVPKDYTGDNVNPQAFLNVITGNKAAMAGVGSGKVLESGPDDHVFINFVDHGAPGLVAFPYDILGARNLSRALKKMHEKKMYKQLVFYMEACDSGSMFDNDLLPKNLSIYATTAANGKESSWACYWNKYLDSFLGDYYSVTWMENVDAVGTLETLAHQFKVIKEDVTKSHPQEFGDVAFTDEEVEQFLGKPTGSRVEESMMRLSYQREHKSIDDAVPSPDVPLAILYHHVEDAVGEQAKSKARLALANELMHRNQIARVMKSIVSKASGGSNDLVEAVLTTKKRLVNFDCYEAAVDAFKQMCYNPARVSYAMQQLYALVNMCESKDFTSRSILAAIRHVCHH